jgi:hypothetical protein
MSAWTWTISQPSARELGSLYSEMGLRWGTLGWEDGDRDDDDRGAAIRFAHSN